MELLLLLLLMCAKVTGNPSFGLGPAVLAAIQYQDKEMAGTLFWTETKFYIICSGETCEHE